MLKLQGRLPVELKRHRFQLYMHEAPPGGTAYSGVGAASQLDLTSLMPLSVTGCG